MHTEDVLVSKTINFKYAIAEKDTVLIKRLDRSFLGGLPNSYFKKFTGKKAVVVKVYGTKIFPLLVIPEGYKSGMFVKESEVEKL